MVNQWWRTHFGSLPHETHKVPYADIAIEMVGSGLGVTFVFGTGWKIDEKTTKRIPVYDAHDKRVARKGLDDALRQVLLQPEYKWTS